MLYRWPAWNCLPVVVIVSLAIALMNTVNVLDASSVDPPSCTWKSWLDFNLLGQCPVDAVEEWTTLVRDDSNFIYDCGGGSDNDNWTSADAVVRILRPEDFHRLLDQMKKYRNNKDKACAGQLPWSCARCALINFFSPYCTFSARFAEDYNTLPALFPHLLVTAIDATEDSSRYNYVYGIVATPTVVLIYKGEQVARLEPHVKPLNLTQVIRFVEKHTNLRAHHNLPAWEKLSSGPLNSTMEKPFDWYLVVSWIFIAASIVYYGLQLACVRQFFNIVHALWIQMQEQEEEYEDNDDDGEEEEDDDNEYEYDDDEDDDDDDDDEDSDESDDDYYDQQEEKEADDKLHQEQQKKSEKKETLQNTI